jgi:predicted transcriptional regulator
MPMQKLYIKKLLETSKKFQRKYYYENILANENITAKTNISWVADITEVEL